GGAVDPVVERIDHRPVDHELATAEDEVHVAVDLGVVDVLAKVGGRAGVPGQQRVLVAVEDVVAVGLPVAFHGDGHRLGTGHAGVGGLVEGVGEGDVLRGEVAGLHVDGGRSLGAVRGAGRRVHLLVVVGGGDGHVPGVAGGAEQRQVPLAGRD